MAKKDKTKKNPAGSELLENPEAIAERLSRTEEFLENNKIAVFGVLLGVVLLVGGFFGYRYYLSTQNDIAQAEMFQAVFYFEKDSLDYALNGDGNSLGFLTIADDFPGTKAANLANFYSGAAYLKQGKFPLAIVYLEDFSSSDLLLQGRAYSLLGDAHMELKEYDEAINWYKKAAGYKPNKFFTPGYMLKLALAYELTDNNEEALKVYTDLIKEYWDTNEANEAKKYKAKLGG